MEEKKCGIEFEREKNKEGGIRNMHNLIQKWEIYNLTIFFLFLKFFINGDKLKTHVYFGWLNSWYLDISFSNHDWSTIKILINCFKRITKHV